MIRLRSLVLAGLLALPLASSFGQVGISVGFAPPALPVYQQPPCPVEGYLWTPGYWGYGYDVGDYYWVPGAWVPPPSVGVLWTPPWWGWNNGVYAFNQGYWGPTVGFYGGINYGYGYTGNGYWGGRWEGNAFRYNTAVTRVNTNIVRNTYVDRSVTKQVTNNRTSFNGPNGVKAQPTAEQKAAAANAKKMPPTSQQLARQQAAAKDRNLQASVNKGRPKPEAIQSFNKNTGEGKVGAQGTGAAAGAGAGKGENKIGNASEVNRQGAGAGRDQAGKGPGAGAGKGENKTGNATERNLQGAGAGKTGQGNTGANRNKTGSENLANRSGTENRGNRNVGGNQGNTHSGKTAGREGGAAHEPRQTTSRSGQPKTAAHGPQMATHNAQMGKRPPATGGGNRPHPSGGQPQGKKKPGKP